MSGTRICYLILKLFFILSFFLPLQSMAAESSTNGVYGGYVGSDRWFSEMRNSNVNAEIRRSYFERGVMKLPAGYVEFAGKIVFPKGNPFPKKQFPDLRIICRNKSADNVERAPFIDQDGGFYSVFKEGETYDLYWMYYFGGREKFSSISLTPDGSLRRKQAIEYNPSDEAGENVRKGVNVPAEVPSDNKERTMGSENLNQFDLSGLPAKPTTFSEQRLFDEINFATTPVLKAKAHEKLANYYLEKGDNVRAQSEQVKADYWAKQTE